MIESGSIKDTEETIRLVRRLPSFAALDEDQVRIFIQSSTLRKYQAGETIIKEGESDSRIYILICGQVKVLKTSTQISELQRCGDVFGEIGVIDGGPRSATVKAIKPTLCLAIDVEPLKSMAPERGIVLQAILYRIFSEVLAARLRSMDKEMAAMKRELAAYKAKEHMTVRLWEAPQRRQRDEDSEE